MDYVNALKSRLNTKQAFINLKPPKPPTTGIVDSQFLQETWKKEQKHSLKNFLCWYYNKVVLPNLEAMQKMITFYRGNEIDLLKLGFTLINLANNCLQKYTDAEFYPLTEGDKNILQQTPEDVVHGPSLVFTLKVVADETFLQKPTNVFKPIVKIVARQLLSYSMCLSMVLYALESTFKDG